MPTIHLTTFIAAPIDRVFDLSRSIFVHKQSMIKFNETVASGITTGLLSVGEVVTWKSKHLYKTRFFKLKVLDMNPPTSFTEVQIKGDFKSYKHEHFFKPVRNGTLVIDLFHFEIRYGKAGVLFNKVYLTNYIRTVLEHRNKFLKEYAESKKWESLLNK